MPIPYNPAGVIYPREILFTCAKGTTYRNVESSTLWTEGTTATCDNIDKSQKQNFG